MTLSPVDRLDVTILVDNTVNMLLGSAPPAVRRHRLDVERPGLLAEHGIAMLVSVTKGDKSSTFLFDAGLSRDALTHNMDVLEVHAQDIQAVVLSHGHADHCGGLAGMARRWGKRRLPVLLHPDAYLMRKVVLPDGSEVRLPPPDLRSLAAEGIDVIEDRQPSYVVEGLALVTGGVPRTVDVETGFPIHYAQVQGAWQPDPWIHDDQAVVVNVRDKGLVVLTGCGHAGIINILKYARAATGVESVHGVIGGMHLEGGIFEPRIQRTVEALVEMRPQVVVPGHCTGWRATHALADALPDAFAPNSVGTRYTFAPDSCLVNTFLIARGSTSSPRADT